MQSGYKGGQLTGSTEQLNDLHVDHLFTYTDHLVQQKRKEGRKESNQHKGCT